VKLATIVEAVERSNLRTDADLYFSDGDGDLCMATEVELRIDLVSGDQKLVLR
jgi:hypothetical protein